MRPRTASERGVTLVEALVVLALLGITLAVALPNFRMYLVRSRVITPVRDIERLTSMVRLRAINAQRPGVIVFVKEGSTHADLAAHGQAAHFVGRNGVVAFVDEDSDGLLDPGEQMIDAYPLPRSLAYKHPAGSEPVPTARAVYSAGGTLAGGGTFRVYFGDSLGNYMRLVIVGSGQVRREKNIPGETDETSGWRGVGQEQLWVWRY